MGATTRRQPNPYLKARAASESVRKGLEGARTLSDDASLAIASLSVREPCGWHAAFRADGLQPSTPSPPRPLLPPSTQTRRGYSRPFYLASRAPRPSPRATACGPQPAARLTERMPARRARSRRGSRPSSRGVRGGGTHRDAGQFVEPGHHALQRFHRLRGGEHRQARRRRAPSRGAPRRGDRAF